MGSNRPTVAKLAAAINEMESKFVRRSINDIWHVIRMTNENADELRKRLDALQQPQKPVEVSVKADEQSLTAYVHQLEAFINDIEKELSNRLDVHRVDIDALEHRDDAMHDLVTRTANSLYAEIKKLERRVSDCELAVGTDKLEPAPQRNTRWHPYNAKADVPPEDNDRVVVMLRWNGEILRPSRAADHLWTECGDITIVAWRYANEGE